MNGYAIRWTRGYQNPMNLEDPPLRETGTPLTLKVHRGRAEVTQVGRRFPE